MEKCACNDSLARFVASQLHLRFMKIVLTFLSLGVAWTLSASANLKVATLHPVLTDLAQQVGGDHVEVNGLLKLGGDPHDFAPSAADIRSLSTAKLVLASGKGLEPYLEKLSDNLSEGQVLLEVGRAIPSITISEDSALFVCCPHHSEGSLDPHWWHSVKAMERATGIVEKAFAESDPANAKVYKERAKAYKQELEALGKWARKEVAKIPRSHRKLATAHAAFTYFCQEFGFQSMPIQGLSKEYEVTSQYLADVAEELKAHEIQAVFPEAASNPKVLGEMIRGTQAGLGTPLFADFTGSEKARTYKQMFEHNVTVIVKALGKR